MNPQTPKPPRLNKSRRILEILLQRGAMTTTEIQTELWKMTYPNRPFDRSRRGYWGTNLYGSTYHAGLLYTWATKGSDGKWRPRYQTVPRKPWTQVYNPNAQVVQLPARPPPVPVGSDPWACGA
jgi:hypothetical protein